LRKYGVRFGAYHIYIPQLLKPAPRALATQLFALKQDNPEVPGLEEVQQLASSGRTSIPVNKEIQKPLYRTAGYRVCGERAVRVDILERLADLIRPALAWRDNAPGVKPQGALDGTGFTVTVGMTSLVGSSGEDFASILRALGYRMERRPKPAEPIAEISVPADAAVSAEATPASETTVIDTVPQPAETIPPSAPREITDSPSLLPENHFAPPVTEPSPAETAPEAAPLVPEQEEASAEQAVADPVALEAAGEPAGPSASAEPDMVEVWRPGRFENRDRNRNARGVRHHGRKHGDRSSAPAASDANAPALAADAQPSPAADTDQPNGEKRHQRGRRPHRGDRPEGQRPQHHGKRNRHEDKRGERHERPERRERPERQPDPNSPFAKLAALKAQLESGAKEQS
jgi:ATP-dependent RNA helicase SUPV3L1/SUV3